MNTLKAVGYIFTTFGFLLLLAGFIFGVNAYTAVSSFLINSYGQYTNSMIQTLFWASATPYFIGSVPMFIIGIVGFYAGRDMEKIVDKLPSQKNPIRVELQSPSMNAMYRTNGAASGKSKIVCGSCGVTNDLDAVFCKKCGDQFQ